MTEETRFQSIDEVFDDMYRHIPDPDPIRRAEARQAVLAHVDARLAGQVSTDTGLLENRSSGFVDTFIGQRRMMIMLEIIVAIILAGAALIGGVSYAADGAGPGDPLYGIDRTMENVRGSLISNEDTLANFQAKLATERLMEAQEDEYSAEALAEFDKAVEVLTALLDSGNLSPDTQAELEALLADLAAQRDSLDSNLNDEDNSAGEDDSLDDQSSTNVEDSSVDDGNSTDVENSTGVEDSSSDDENSTGVEDSNSDDEDSTDVEDNSSGDESNTGSEDDSSDEGDDSNDENDDSSSIESSLGPDTTIIATDSNSNTGSTVDSTPSPDTGGSDSSSDSSSDHGDDHHDDHEDDHDDEGDDD